ncbi:MAG: hypothetical protein K0Q52_107 [Microbacterium sp.]|jgi:hypothetical protein|nr:hypothetical protein [Microbacterium sp.]
MKLTELQLEVLDQVGTRWLRPMDMGARDGSHHSAVLAALVRKGLVERTQRGGLAYARGSYVYRITTQGLATRANAPRLTAEQNR